MSRKLWTIMIILSLGLLLCACSGDESITEQASKKVDKVTTDTAHKITTKIKTPINKARLTKTYGDDRLKQMDKALQEQK